MIDIMNLVPVVKAAVYNGTNGAEIVAQFSGEVLADDGTTLTFKGGGQFDSVREAVVGQLVMWAAASGEGAVFGVSNGVPDFYAQVPAV